MLKKIACLSILLTLIGVPSFAQKITATIRGTVTDTTGAVVPGANVTVRGENTGVTRSTVTNSSGVYSFPELQVGNDAVEVAVSGFKTTVIKGVALNVLEDRRGTHEQGRRLQRPDPGLPVGGRDRRVQGAPEQVRRRVRRSRRPPGEHRHPRRYERVPRGRLLLRAEREAGLVRLLPEAGRPAQGAPEGPRFWLDPGRSDHQGQASLLRLPGMEPRAARHLPGHLRPDR